MSIVFASFFGVIHSITADTKGFRLAKEKQIIKNVPIDGAANTNAPYGNIILTRNASASASYPKTITTPNKNTALHTSGTCIHSSALYG